MATSRITKANVTHHLNRPARGESMPDLPRTVTFLKCHSRPVDERSKITVAKIGVPQRGQLCVIACSKTKLNESQEKRPHISDAPEIQPDWNHRNAMRNTLGIRLISPARPPCGPIPYGNRPMAIPLARSPLRPGPRARSTKTNVCLGSIQRFPTFRQNTWSSARQGSSLQHTQPSFTMKDIGMTAQIILSRAGLERQNTPQTYRSNQSGRYTRAVVQNSNPLRASVVRLDSDVAQWMDGLVDVRQITAHYSSPPGPQPTKAASSEEQNTSTREQPESHDQLNGFAAGSVSLQEHKENRSDGESTSRGVHPNSDVLPEVPAIDPVERIEPPPNSSSYPSETDTNAVETQSMDESEPKICEIISLLEPTETYETQDFGNLNFEDSVELRNGADSHTIS
ncbi:hypothetical protein FGIG_07703 [Fasciola gigantica]|uniref:Uncharacterized protein n=1 Tax=Fasciola gigantica TaxID=46835 RepID=A0A504Z1Z3_FASGI|nr:hypothetical protein FGIG_07703 [Fasciola gigantica]